MTDDQMEILLRVIPTRRDLLTILEVLCEDHHGEITAVQIYAAKIRQVLLRKWKEDGTLIDS